MKKILFGFILITLVGCSKPNQSVPDINQGASISGMISISPELQAQLKPTDTLFIIARKEVGPPLAVKKMTDLMFPLPYALTSRDVMFPGTPFQGEVTITARIDRDGNAGPAQAGDLEGTTTKNPARVGDQDVNIVINRAL